MDIAGFMTAALAPRDTVVLPPHAKNTVDTGKLSKTRSKYRIALYDTNARNGLEERANEALSR